MGQNMVGKAVNKAVKKPEQTQTMEKGLRHEPSKEHIPFKFWQ